MFNWFKCYIRLITDQVQVPFAFSLLSNVSGYNIFLLLWFDYANRTAFLGTTAVINFTLP